MKSLPDGDTPHQNQSKRHGAVNRNTVKTSKKVIMSSPTKAFSFPITAVKFHHHLIELFQLEDICGRLLDDFYQRATHCKRVAATAAAAVVVAAVAVVVAGVCSTMCKVLLSSLLVLPCSHFFLPRFSPSASSARLRVSSTLSSWLACSAALLAARQIRRRPRAVRMRENQLS